MTPNGNGISDDLSWRLNRYVYLPIEIHLSLVKRYSWAFLQTHHSPSDTCDNNRNVREHLAPSVMKNIHPFLQEKVFVYYSAIHKRFFHTLQNISVNRCTHIWFNSSIEQIFSRNWWKSLRHQLISVFQNVWYRLMRKNWKACEPFTHADNTTCGLTANIFSRFFSHSSFHFLVIV